MDPNMGEKVRGVKETGVVQIAFQLGEFKG